MLQVTRYRQGIDARTGALLTGRAHLAQSLAKIWSTRISERVMLLDFGSKLRSHLAEDLTLADVYGIYNDLTDAIYEWEPEYRVRDFQLVSLTRIGGIGIRHAGLYYPEGRFNNYDLVEDFGGVAALARYEQAAMRLQ